ncbi:MAG: GGDEF domain-containing protein [Magnetococcales bacterium]|nr:GGDEF domain-containing protein [Magnetococcales bacterium]MBF0149629.1 GGDEF domain-containing protein [Magnetococcales bacterium]
MGELGTFYKKGEFIFKKGDPSDCMYVVQKGRVEIVMISDYGTTRLSVRKKGDFIGETSMFACKTRFASARALTDARVLKLDEKSFIAKIHQDPSLAFNTIKQMAKRIYEQDHTLMRGFLHQNATCCDVTGFTSYIDLAAFLDGEVKRARRLRHIMAFAIVDVDNYKELVVEHGVEVAVNALRALSSIFQEHLRGIDIVGRFGDDRFGLLLYEADGRTAMRIMETVKASFAEHWSETELEGTQPTFSCGIAIYPEHERSVFLSKAAYKALIQCKAGGKNQIILAPPQPGRNPVQKSLSLNKTTYIDSELDELPEPPDSLLDTPPTEPESPVPPEKPPAPKWKLPFLSPKR